MSSNTPRDALRGKRVLVTGASRGIGRGIAIGLGELGATVIVTSRKESNLDETAAMVRAAGGECIPLAVDHSDDDAVLNLFKRFNNDEPLDILVNNAYSAVPFLMKSARIKSWQRSVETPDKPCDTSRPGEVWDLVNTVGLRNNYVCSNLALRHFAERGNGIVVNVSSWGGIMRIFDVAYGVGKAGVDRLSSDMAKEAPKGVTCFTYYPGLVATEALSPMIGTGKIRELSAGWNAETPLFVGRALAGGLARQDMVKTMRGRIVIAAELGKKVGAKDENGFSPESFRSLRFIMAVAIPGLAKSPLFRLVPNIYFPLGLVQSFAGTIKAW